jgi:sugar/nucleoside kinase (ribokinase family)
VIELLAFGEVNPDIVVTGVPELTFGQREDLVEKTGMTVGSSVAIMSCGAARLGVAVGLVGVVGADAFGDFMLDRLDRRGVDTSLISRLEDGRTGSSVIVVRSDDANDRHILTDPGVMGELRISHARLADLPDLRHFHVGSWFLQTGAVDELPALLQSARARGISTSVDPNDDPARAWDSGLREGLAHIDILFCNEAEAVGIAGGHLDPLAASRHLLASMPDGATVLLKQGASGARLLTGDREIHVAAPAMQVLDTVGAGDSLAAGYLASMLRGLPPDIALATSVAAGSLSTRRSGGVDGQATWEEVTELTRQLTASDGRSSDAPLPDPTIHSGVTTHIHHREASQ